MARVRFIPSRYTKRLLNQRRSYSLSAADVEKRRASSDEDDECLSECSISTASSSYGSQDGMLQKGEALKTAAQAYAPQRRCNRIFTLWLSAFLIIFVSTLTLLHHLSARQVEAHTNLSEDRNRTWEEFPQLQRYFGGIKSLVPFASNTPEFPSTKEEIIEQLKNGTLTQGSLEAETMGRTPRRTMYEPVPVYRHEAVNECFLDPERTIRIPRLRPHNGVVAGFPSSAVGSSAILDVTAGACFDRFAKLGPYGYGYSQKLGGTGAGLEGDRDGAAEVWSKDQEIDYRIVSWADAQHQCEQDNHRWSHDVAQTSDRLHSITNRSRANETVSFSSLHERLRIAVVVRTWSDYQYDPEDIIQLRALLSELSLTSGATYAVHFLIHVRDDNVQIWSDDATHQRILAEALPYEFRDLGTLWSERQMGLVYGGVDEAMPTDLPVYGNARSTFLPLQHFANEHPEFGHVWNLEMDVRYTGHMYELLVNAGLWAKQQPRKGLWERNARFYLPSEHGSWDDFQHMARVQSEHGTNSKSNIWRNLQTHSGMSDTTDQGVRHHVWGPSPPQWDEVQDVADSEPPTLLDQDKYHWGVGEEADLITFAPMFDPQGTEWPLRDDISGYNTSVTNIPRRASLGTTVRLSRRLLEIMHRETALKRHRMVSEMWSPTCALHHGLKAVYVPQPVYIDRQWPTDYLAAVLNGGLDGASGGSRMSVFSETKVHNLMGLTWSPNSAFATRLWKRWMGYKVDGEGGEEWELANEGRMCLPPMLLHPMKQLDFVFEHSES
ncbi:MAG: hypothetical protein M1828_000551 [Chrysothrix sp. TS-e1954]|nr:MAG: hypothetical protein M1828_000551 [Chrysothrix sp. TS-e1954]